MEVQLGSRVLSWTVFCFIWLPGPTSCACGRQAALHSVFLHLSCINYLKYFDSKERPGIPMRPLAAPAKARRTQTAMGTRPPSAPSGCSCRGRLITISGVLLVLLALKHTQHFYTQVLMSI